MRLLSILSIFFYSIENVIQERIDYSQDIADMPIVILENPYIPPGYINKQKSDFILDYLTIAPVEENIAISTSNDIISIQINNKNELHESVSKTREYKDQQKPDNIQLETLTTRTLETDVENGQPEIVMTCITQGQDKSSDTAYHDNSAHSLAEIKNQTEIKKSYIKMKNSSESSEDEHDHDYNILDANSMPESDNEVNQNEEEPEEELNEDENTQKTKNRQGRKRTRNESEWKGNKRKKARTSGQEYTSSRNTKIRARQLKGCCKETCKLKCFKVFSNEERQNILQSFWNKDVDYDRKRQFVASCVDETPVQRRRNRNGTREGKRIVTYIYTLTSHGSRTRVCKRFFLNTLDISQNFVDHALRKTLAGGIIKGDLRKGHTPQNKIPEEIRQGIRDHINKFPYYESHYNREKSSRKYLECDLNVTKMYQLYYDEAVAANILPEHIGKLWLYRDIFNTEFNLSFKKPSNDTCDACDSFTIKLKDSTDPNQRQILQSNYNEHIEDSQLRYKMKAADKEYAKIAKNKKVIMIDLEKCLATPLLKNAQSFYSLKLWTFNLTIHDSTVNKTFCMMWDETVSGRGGNEVASAIIKWLKVSSLDPQVEELTIWSDNCPSQNRNLMMVMCYFYIFNICPSLHIINHKYLLRGHTHLEADTDHALIEKQVKKTPAFQIATPWDWQQLVRITSPKFAVVDMGIKDFLDMKSLYSDKNSAFIKSRKSESGNVLRISEAVHLQVQRQNPGHLFFKTKFSQAEFEEVNFSRRANNQNAGNLVVSPIRESSKPLSIKKYKQLINLLEWVPSRFHQFYKEIKHSENVSDDDE